MVIEARSRHPGEVGITIDPMNQCVNQKLMNHLSIEAPSKIAEGSQASDLQVTRGGGGTITRPTAAFDRRRQLSARPNTWIAGVPAASADPGGRVTEATVLPAVSATSRAKRSAVWA